MTVTVPKAGFGRFYRIQQESAFGAGGGAADWPTGGNGGGATGWRDWPVNNGQAPIPANEAQIFATLQAGRRSMNQQAPVPGAYSVEHSLEFPVILELLHPFLYGTLGGQSLVETAGVAALSSTAFASVATLDTQPDGTEVLKFTIASSTAASAASIEIIQSGATVETVEIGTSASSVDGVYYSQGAYDGSVNAITFSINGTVTSGMVVVAGVNLVTGTFTIADTIPSFRIEEAGLPRSASNSFLFPGSVITSLALAYDRTAADGLLMATAAFASQFGVSATAGTYANAAREYYHPLGGWTASLLLDGSAWDMVQSANLTINGGNALFPVSSGNQNPSGKIAGDAEVTGTIRVIDEDADQWNAFIGQTVMDVHLVFTSPQSIVDSTKWSMTLELTKLYIENYVPVEVTAGGARMLGADLTVRTVEDSSDGPIKITTVDRMAT